MREYLDNQNDIYIGKCWRDQGKARIVPTMRISSIVSKENKFNTNDYKICFVVWRSNGYKE